MSVNFSSQIVRRGLPHSLRFELSFVFIVGVIFPTFLVAWIEAEIPVVQRDIISWLANPVILNSILGVSVSTIVAILILRRLRFLPGVAVAKSIFPVISLCFSLFLIAITAFRIEYSGRLIVVTFCCVVISRFAITALRARARGLLYCIVPGGRSGVIRQLKAAPVVLLDTPSLANLPDCALVADLYAELEPQWERFLAEAAISGRPVYHYKQVWEAETGKVQIEHLSENGFGALVPSFSYQKMKRAVDVALLLAALPFILPILSICALVIKWDSRGVDFFRQRRMGFRGHEFYVLKLRTMSEGCDGGARALSVTHVGDKRITSVGTFLRRTRLDELPQVINILRGEMSWIGPRPEAVSLSNWYEGEIPFYRYRHIVRPGITGWAQVNQGHVADLHEVDEKLQYDFYYIKNLSYWLDIVITLRTIKVVLSGFGSK